MMVESPRFATHARGAKIKLEQLRAFDQYMAENASIFEDMRTLICKVPPAPAVTKVCHPKQYVATSSPTISDISESNETGASVTTLTETSSDKSFSPVVRKCTEGLESQLDEKLASVVRSVMKENGGKLETMREHSPITDLLNVPATSVNSAQWNVLRTELRLKVRDELSRSIMSIEQQLGTADASLTVDSEARVTKDQVTRGLGFTDDHEDSELPTKDHVFKLPTLPAAKPRKRKVQPPPSFDENIKPLHNVANKRNKKQTKNFE